MAKKSKKIKKVKVVTAPEVKRGRGRPKKVVESLPEPIPTPVPAVVAPVPAPEPVSVPVVTRPPKLSCQIVLELNGVNGPVVFTKQTEFTDPVTKILMTEAMTENRQGVERDLQEYVSKNPELFEGKKKPIYKVMTAGGAQNAFVKKS